MKRATLLISAAVAAGFLAALAAGSFAEPADAGGGRAGYGVAASDDNFVLWELRSGRAWVLQESQRNPGRFAWVLINRLEDERSSEEWRLTNRFRHTAEPPR